MRYLLVVLLAAGAAFAQRPVIDISNARIQAYPIAIAPPLGNPDAGRDVLSVLAADFDRSALFKVLDPRSFLASPGEGTSEAEIDFSKWAAIGAQGLVKAIASAPGDGVSLEFHLYDVPGAREVLHGTYSAPRAALRQVAHRFGDDVVRLFTGQPGFFQTRIAWVRDGGDGKQIVVSDYDGHAAQALTSASINLLPAWAPDGRSLAFTSFRDGGGAHLYSIDAATHAVRALVNLGDFASGAAFAPDGSRLGFSASVDENTDIYVSRPDGGGVRRLTDSRGIDISASWSPDGKQIAFVSDRAGSPQIYVMNADGTGVRRLTFQGNYNQEPAWSPRGDVIAFSGRDERRVFDLYTVDVRTGKIARLTQDQGTNEKPAWAPNGRLLLFSSTRTGKRQIWSMAPDGSGPRQVTDEPRGASDPAWGPLPAR
jgi:TolB protein